MDVSKCEQKSNKKPDLSCLPIADSAMKLEPLVKQRYLEKISAIGIDPVLIEGKHFEADCLPPVESTDLLFYLVLETSFYTQQQFEAFRSLEAFPVFLHFQINISLCNEDSFLDFMDDQDDEVNGYESILTSNMPAVRKCTEIMEYLTQKKALDSFNLCGPDKKIIVT